LLETPIRHVGPRQDPASPRLQAFCAQERLYDALSRDNPGPGVTLHERPPYANGALHVGPPQQSPQDIINKYALLRGRRARVRAGLGTATACDRAEVLQSMGRRSAALLTPDRPAPKAHAICLEQDGKARRRFSSVGGFWADWDDGLTSPCRGAYERPRSGFFGPDGSWRGHIYRGPQARALESSSRTALAEAELDYPDGHHVPERLRGLPVDAAPDDMGQGAGRRWLSPTAIALGLPPWGPASLAVAIWTHPWTLRPTLAGVVNGTLGTTHLRASRTMRGRMKPRANCQHLIVAAAGWCEMSCKNRLGLRLGTLLTVKGQQLEGLHYRHPLLRSQSPVVIGGLLHHTEAGHRLVPHAPATGEMIQQPRKYNLPGARPVDAAAPSRREKAGPFAGLNVLKDANRRDHRRPFKRPAPCSSKRAYAHR